MKLFYFTSLILFLIGVSCINSKLIKFQYEKVKLINVKGITFNCKLTDTSSFGEHKLIGVNWILKNNSGKDVNYISQTCNGLELFLVASPNTYRVNPNHTCNATWPQIAILKNSDSIVINSQLLQLKASKSLEKIGLDFRTVDKYFPLEQLKKHPELIEEAYIKETNEFILY